MEAAKQLQELADAITNGQPGPAATLSFALAGRGALPMVELFGVAGMLGAAGQADQAIALYRIWLRQTPSPIAYAARFNLAVLLSQGGDEAGAEQEYRSALALKPDFTEAHLNLGSLLERAAQQEQALETWREALARIDVTRPDQVALHTQVLNNLGRLLEIRKRYPEAEAMLADSLLRDPLQPNAITHLVHLRQKQCKWPVYVPFGDVTVRAQIDATSALATLSASDDPATQLRASRRFVEEKVLRDVAPLSDQDGYAHSRLRVGYLSSDLCSHAVSILTAELFELHDRNMVEVYAFSWSNEDGSPLRARVVNAMDHYIRIGGLNDEQAAQLIRGHEIDILVDLHGLTLGARPGILSYRPAPVQITYLGFPGPTAMPAIDYVLADEFVLPPELAPHFTEKPLYLPNCFQINDRRRLVGVRPTRAACGLPEDAFVFCSFNNNHKFTPEVFASWMRILQRVPDSLLWLLADSAEVQANLLAAAAAHGVDGARLVFAGRVLPADYLARFQAADLFLDTLPFNAGTTASDALWAGLPLLTRAGRSFAGRMAGSLLKAIGLPELITYSEQEYEDRAVQLAQAPGALAALRQRLADNRDSEPLFDSPRFVRDLEQVYRRVARGSLLLDESPQRAPASKLPLVSILITGHDADALASTLASALAQSYEHCEIIIGDYSAGEVCHARIAPYLASHPRLRYQRAPELRPAEVLNRCLALALGKYVACAPAGDVLAPDKIASMMHYFQHYPTIGLVAAMRQPLAADGSALPLPALFPRETAIGGVSLATLLLTNGNTALCAPGALLMRRADLGTAFGHYMGHQYHELAGVAAALAALADRDCVYLPQALGSYTPQLPDHAATLAASMEALQLLYGAHAQRRFLTAPGQLKQLLTARLTEFTAFVAANHAALGSAAGHDIEAIQLVIRQGYQLLLAT